MIDLIYGFINSGGKSSGDWGGGGEGILSLGILSLGVAGIAAGKGVGTLWNRGMGSRNLPRIIQIQLVGRAENPGNSSGLRAGMRGMEFLSLMEIRDEFSIKSKGCGKSSIALEQHSSALATAEFRFSQKSTQQEILEK